MREGIPRMSVPLLCKPYIVVGACWGAWVIGVLLISPVLVSPGVRAQHSTVVVSSEPVANPVSVPEPRHRIATSPLAIFTNLSSEKAEARRIAYSELGIDSSLESLDIDALRLEFVNLDSDGDAEAILIYTIGRRLTTAVVFDKAKDGWWQVGAFDYSWHWKSETAERLLGLKEIVSLSQKDLVVRQESGGTGVVRTDLAIYRMYKGALYRVFKINEFWYYDAIGQREFSAYLEKHDVKFYDADAAGRPSIVVRHTKTEYPSDLSATPKTKTLGCIGYAWDAPRFVFQSDDAITAKLCGTKADLR
jgi:hypothetical protein